MLRCVVGGCSTYSKAPIRFPANYPKGLVVGNGCKVRGADNKTYIDLISGLGAIFLGYQDARVDRAVLKQLRTGVLFSLPHPIEEEVAEQFCRMTGWDQVRWCKNGSDATEAAVRLARYLTNRDMVLTLGGYHGFHSDLVTATPGKRGGILDRVSQCCRALSLAAPDFLAHLRVIAHSSACLIAEPIMFQQPLWSDLVHALAGTGCLLIFDEVISGFRYRAGRALETPVPDLACYGKAIGNGYPIACVAGSSAIMQEFSEHVFFSGTAAAECLSLAAAGAVLKTIETDKDFYQRMGEAGARLACEFTEAAHANGILATCAGLPPRTQFRFENPAHFDLFRAEMCEQGVLLGHDNFLSVSHTMPIMEQIVAACRRSLFAIHQKGSLDENTARF